MADSHRILVAEDARDMQLLIRCFLDSPIYKLDMTENGQQALELFTRGSYDLILMDLRMPIMDGYEATRCIRSWEREQGLHPVPVIAASAMDSLKELDQCLAAGCTAHIRKPYLKQQLQRTMSNWLAPIEERSHSI